MRVRGLLATTALLTSAVLLPQAIAEEAVDEVCLLVQDDANDTVYQGLDETSGVVVQRDIDITSADVSTTEDHLFAVIRVQELNSRPPTSYLQGQTTYRLEFASGGRRFYVQVPTGWGTLSPTRYYWPWGATAGRVGGRAHHAWSQLDRWNSEITIDAPLHVFGRNALKPGAVITDYAVTAVRTITDNGQVAPGVSSGVTISDAASSKATYGAATPSCITPDPADEPVVEPAPAEPSEEPAPPSEEPAPAEPTEPPAEPTEEPAPPSEEPPAEPTEAPAEPTETPTEPTEAPAEPTEAPAEPTESPTEG